MESAVKVCVRVRPLIEREESAALENAQPVQMFWKADKKSIHQIDDGNATKSFVFDRVFVAEETTNQLYQDIAKPLVVSTVEGYNGTIFAYGQTSSGKTFTMMGRDRTHGVIPLAVEDVFQTIKNCPLKEFLLRVSYMEIYNETVSDLLVDSWKRKPLEVRETINKNIFVSDLTEELVTSPEQVLAWIRKGEKNRHYGKTKMNERSSRSHTIFRMILESRERTEPGAGETADGAIIVSHLNLVDLAGSERTSQTGAEGARFKEGCNINRSLFTLGQVMKKLTDESQKGFTNYRDSKLTRILQNSLGGNAKTVIICTITPVALDETLSTLQFASTAKKMKNDPHVTEVSDDGALLKRYRNEIVDLKRRLTEVSSVTQTTATEKQVLSEMLQEKDQLQREQQDRIRNLTKLLVTSSNLVPVRKVPKRRETWGGKMVRLVRPSLCDGPADLSFADPFSRKRKADRSCLLELNEEDEDFESQWEIPDEPSDEMDTSTSSVTVRGFGDGHKDFVSPDYIGKLSGKVSNLELQLDIENQHKEEAMTRAETSDGRVAELELQLQAEAREQLETLERMQAAERRAEELQTQLDIEHQHKEEAVARAETSDGRVAELETQLQRRETPEETQEAEEANEKVAMMEIKVADLEMRLEEQSHVPSETKEMREQFGETLQLCETLSTEKDALATERDYLKRELGMFVEEMKRLEKENAALTKETEEKREMDEFRALEEEFRKGHETEMQNEISELKTDVESSGLRCLELQNKLETLSEELQKKTAFANELQSLSGKDLVQEVATLRRSLDDAEGLSRDTRKEWAHLRSSNMALEETNVTLSADHEKMASEVSGLRCQLEAEKSRYRAMQSDLQKELNVVFEENAKLSALLDGKVPKNLMDGVELERTAARLSRELAASREAEAASREAEAALAAQLEELAALRTLPGEVDELTKKLSERTEELQRERGEKDALLTEQSGAAERTEELLCSVTSLTNERERLTRDLQDNVEMAAETQLLLQSLQDELQEQSRKNSDLLTLAEQKEKEHVQRLSEELRREREEKDALLSEQSGAAERTQTLLCSVAAERDQLQADMQDNVEMMIENQQDLRTALEKNREQKERIRQLEEAQTEDPHGEQLEQLQAELQTLSERLQSARAERDALLETDAAAEQLQSRAAALSEERDQLLDALEAQRQEKRQLRAELEEHMETVALAQSGFNQPETLSSGQQTHDEDEARLQQEIKALQASLQAVSEQKSQLEAELQRHEETVSEARRLQAELQEQKQLHSDHMTVCEQEHSAFDRLAEERQQLQDTAEAARLHTATLEERLTRLNESVETTTEEKRRLEEELQLSVHTASSARELVKTLQEDLSELQLQRQETERQAASLTERLQLADAERERLDAGRRAAAEETEELQSRAAALGEEREQLLDALEAQRQEKRQLEDKMAAVQVEATSLTERLQLADAERERLDAGRQSAAEQTEELQSRAAALGEEREQLLDALEAQRQEKRQLRAELEEHMETISVVQQKLSELNQFNSQQRADGAERENRLQETVQRLEEQLQLNESRSRVEADASQQSLSDAHAAASALREQLSRSARGARDASRLRDSTEQLQASLGRFQTFIDICSEQNPHAVQDYSGEAGRVLSKPGADAFAAVRRLELQTAQTLRGFTEHLQARAQGSRNLFQQLAENDLTVFEERRRQDLLLRRAQEPEDVDLQTLWDARLTALLDRRRLYLQKMSVVLEKLQADLLSCVNEMSADCEVRERFKERLRAVCSAGELAGLIAGELDHRAAAARAMKTTLQAIMDEDAGAGPSEELRRLEAEADARLQEERQKTGALLQTLEGTPRGEEEEGAVMKENQQLLLQLQQTEETVKALRSQVEQLDDARVRASSRVSNQKQATQLLQTELQDSRAQLEEKDGAIQRLKSKLRQSERDASPGSAELENLRAKMFKMEVELSSASDKHKLDIQRMSSLLGEKEESVRKLKETLRKSQQEGDDSILQGEDLHARLTHPRGSLIKSSFLLEKSKLEQEVKELQLKVTELESSVSSQQQELSKWRSRALRLKSRSRAEPEPPSSPCTPSKRPLAAASDSALFFSSPKKFSAAASRKLLDSPRDSLLLLSPQKSRIFDVGGSCEHLSRNCPKQFFDNSNLGTVPDGDPAADRKEDLWPRSPKQEEMCKTQ